MPWLGDRLSHLKCACIVILIQDFSEYALTLGNGLGR